MRPVNYEIRRRMLVRVSIRKNFAKFLRKKAQFIFVAHSFANFILRKIVLFLRLRYSFLSIAIICQKVLSHSSLFGNFAEQISQ